VTTSSTTDNARKFGRYNVSYEIQITIDGKTVPASVINESIGGLRFSLKHPVNVSVGHTLTVRQNETEHTGYVRNLGWDDEGQLFVGVSWDAPSVADAEEDSRRGDFFKFGEFDVICRERVDVDTCTSQIKLWDGATFTAKCDCLQTISRTARASKLMMMQSELAVLAKLYGVPTTGNRNTVVERLLDFEFPTA